MSLFRNIKENPKLLIFVLPAIIYFFSSGDVTFNSLFHSFIILVIIFILAGVVGIMTPMIYEFIIKKDIKDTDTISKLPIFLAGVIMATILIINQSVSERKKIEEMKICVNDIGIEFERGDLDGINNLEKLIEYCSNYYGNTSSPNDYEKPNYYE